MNQYTEIRLSGSSGQGLMLAGSILAEAAGLYDGKEVIQSRSYGPESRGGASRSEVIISTTPIDYPEVVQPDVVVAMTEEACQKWTRDMKEDGIIIVDPKYVRVTENKDKRLCVIPITEIAVESTGKEITANLAALGALIGLTQIVSTQAMEEAIRNRVPAGTEEMNLRAFRSGAAYGERVKMKDPSTSQSAKGGIRLV